MVNASESAKVHVIACYVEREKEGEKEKEKKRKKKEKGGGRRERASETGSVVIEEAITIRKTYRIVVELKRQLIKSQLAIETQLQIMNTTKNSASDMVTHR